MSTMINRRDLLKGAAATAFGAGLLSFLGPQSAFAQAQATAGAMNLKIDQVKSFIVEPRSIFVKVYTNQGISGVGVAIQTSMERSVATSITEMGEKLIGENPIEIERIWEDLYQAPRWRGGQMLAAISAIDMALWDILGQAVGLPVYALLGGKVHDKIKQYDRGGRDTAESWQETFDAGYTASRIGWPTGSVTEQIDYIHRVREAAGPDHEIAVHGSGTLPTSDALQIMVGVEDCNLLFCEEPIQMDVVDDWRHLRSHTSTPIATGERLVGKNAFLPYIQENLIDFAQPDLGACGGILEAKKICIMAEAKRIRMAPHNPHGPLGALATFHLDAATPNFYVQENRDYENQADLDLHEGLVPVVRDGYAEVPDRPGLGTVLNEEVAAQRGFEIVVRSGGNGLGAGISAADDARAEE